MKFSQLNNHLQRQISLMNQHNDPEVVIELKLPFTTIGGTPTVNVESVQMGFDWDKNKFIIKPETPVTNYDVDFGESMRKLQKECGELFVENRALKSRIKN